ncbi:MAG: methyltransferase domain-containing protein [Actinobacteria bacterium]|nr:methyltransferase domain-containing protein [Actinomycetota bacterium]
MHERDGGRIGYQKICKTEGDPVPEDEIVKAYEVEKDELVVLTDEDFAAAKTEGMKTIEISDFVPYEEIDPIYFERTYYLGRQDGAEKVCALFREAMEQTGLAALGKLDVACGTGRLLLPYLRDGLDVDGCDVSPDMLALCREAAAREGLSASLYAQAMHELDLPRRYRTVFVCGGFGLGSSRKQDLEALRRLHDHLEPDGVLVLDNEVPYADGPQWQYWVKEKRAELPQPPREPGQRRVGTDGAEYALCARVLDLDPLAQQVSWEMRAFMWREGELVAEEEHRLTTTLYFRDELVLMLERAGFVDVQVRGQYNDAEPPPADDFLVFIARKGERTAAY